MPDVWRHYNDGRPRKDGTDDQAASTKDAVHIVRREELFAVPLRSKTATRQRIWSPKVKTGCITCRARRVKCDEHKPDCNKCASSNRVCVGSGYGVDAPPKRSPVASSSHSVAVQPAFAVIPTDAYSTYEDMRVFHFFRTEAAASLAGAFDQRFLSIDLLRAARLYPTVFHACNALGAMYQRENMARIHVSELEQKRLYVVALKQYDEAIKSMVKMTQTSSDQQASQEVLLISCLLFTAICCLQGDLITAMVHLKSGQKLLQEWGSETVGSPGAMIYPERGLISPKPLIAMLSRLCTQSIGLRESAWDGWNINDFSHNATIMHEFRTVADAYEDFEPLCNGFNEFQHRRRFKSPDAMDTGNWQRLKSSFKKSLDAWRDSFYALLVTSPTNTTEIEGRLLLEARYLAFYVQLSWDEESEMDWDQYHAEFTRIVLLTEQAVQLSEQGTVESNGTIVSLPRRAFSYSSSAMDAVFIVTRYCRNHSIRRRGLELLRSWTVKDGICSTALASAIARIMMTIEEAPGKLKQLGAKNDSGCECTLALICHDHRIRNITGSVDGSGKAILLLSTVAQEREGHTGIYVPIEWEA